MSVVMGVMVVLMIVGFRYTITIKKPLALTALLSLNPKERMATTHKTDKAMS